MTISTQNRTAGPFAGNGVTAAFPFTFKVFQASDLKVVRRVDATDVETVLVLNTNYTVTLNPNQNANPGGTVTLSGPLVVGQTLTVTTELAYLQQTELTNQGGFYPQVITNALDRLTIFAQQLFSGLGRSLKYPLSDSGIDPTLPGKNALRGRVLAFHETTGRPIAGPSTTSVGAVSGAIGAVQTVADNIADVNTVADNITDVNAVGQNIGDVNDVADNLVAVGTVVNNIADVNTVAANIADVNAVGHNISNVNVVADNLAAVNTVAANLDDVMQSAVSAANSANSAQQSAVSAANSANSAQQSAVSANDAALQLNEVLDDVIASQMVFPLDLGFIYQSPVSNSFDLGVL